jgi:hypothetical protein
MEQVPLSILSPRNENIVVFKPVSFSRLLFETGYLIQCTPCSGRRKSLRSHIATR